jgi:hypothetical protein
MRVEPIWCWVQPFLWLFYKTLVFVKIRLWMVRALGVGAKCRFSTNHRIRVQY